MINRIRTVVILGVVFVLVLAHVIEGKRHSGSGSVQPLEQVVMHEQLLAVVCIRCRSLIAAG